MPGQTHLILLRASLVIQPYRDQEVEGRREGQLDGRAAGPTIGNNLARRSAEEEGAPTESGCYCVTAAARSPRSTGPRGTPPNRSRGRLSIFPTSRSSERPRPAQETNRGYLVRNLADPSSLLTVTEDTTLNRRELVLAALAAGDGEAHDPVEIQKMLFLVDRKIPEEVDGPHFDFRPYNYGPFDREVYEELENADGDGLVRMIPRGTWSEYELTDEGMEAGREALEALSERGQRYLRTASEFVRTLSFNELVSVIYKSFPDMRENSVFEQA